MYSAVYPFLTEVVFPLVMFGIMLGMGLSLTTGDFRALLKQPRAVLLGLAGQMLLLPLVALLITAILPLPPAIAVGIILLAACPGGITSNAIAFAARADTALSITLTGLSSILVALTLPLWVGFGIERHYGASAQIALPFEATAISLGLITLLPVSLGMVGRRLSPSRAAACTVFFRRFSIAGILFMCLTSTYYNRLLLLDAALVAKVLLASLAMLGGTMGIGYALSRLCTLSRAQGLSIVIEIGVQNIAMVMLVALGMLKNPAMATVPVVYGMAMLVASWVFVRWIGTVSHNSARAPLPHDRPAQTRPERENQALPSAGTK